MKISKLVVLLLCITLLCSAPALSEADKSITITDMTGREITLAEPATRVVALAAADCEILFAIDAGDMLVGRGVYCDFPAEVLNVPSVQSGYDTNLEQIIALEPQLLIMSKMAQTKEQIAALTEAGITVVVSDAQDIEGVYTSIEMIGALMGKTSEADAVVNSMKQIFADVKASITENSDKTIYFEVSPLQYGLWTAGTGTFMNEITEMLGLTNCFSDVEGWAEISEEQVIGRNPDYIVTVTEYYGEGLTPTEEILGRGGWQDITAVKNDAILNIQNGELSRPSPRLTDGAKLMSDFIVGVSENAAP